MKAPMKASAKEVPENAGSGEQTKSLSLEVQECKHVSIMLDEPDVKGT